MSYPPFATWFEQWAPVVARVILGASLLYGASFKIPGSDLFTMMVQMSGSAGIPMPHVAVTLAFLLELATGLMFILGYRVRIAAALLIPFLALLVYYFAQPDLADPMKMGAFINHMLYIALLCYVSVYGARHFALKRD